ncbi:MAG: methyltransferase domain-containing protein [Dongiaceae bacterium]
MSAPERKPSQEETRQHFTEAELDGHFRMLEERVFQVETKWPHFRRLLADIRELARDLPAEAQVVCMERSLLYGGISLFAPFFHRQRFVSIDCSPGSAEGRGAYNKGMVDDARCLLVPTTLRAAPAHTGLPAGSIDLVMVPNLVHHVPDQSGLFAEVARLLKPGARGYIFEPLVRELHQAPDDYLRYTPWGFEKQIADAGMVYERFVPEGGPFQAIGYCWTQALEYFPAEKRAEMQRWFYERHMPELMAWDDAYRDNQVRKHTTFPMAYAVHFHKPAHLREPG